MNRRRFIQRNGLWLTGALAFPAIVRAQVLPSARRIASPTPSSSGTTLLTDLISYWKMDEATGTGNRADSHDSNALTPNASITAAAGILGNAVSVGSTSWLSHANNASLSTGDIDFTFSVWIKPQSASGNVLTKTDASAGDEYAIDSSGSKFRFYIGNGATYKTATAANTYTNGNWYFVVGWHDASLDLVGVKVNSDADVTAPTAGVAPDSGGAPFYIASYRGGNAPASWLIDEVGFWKRLLTPTEKANLYNSGAGLAYPFS